MTEGGQLNKGDSSGSPGLFNGLSQAVSFGGKILLNRLRTRLDSPEEDQAEDRDVGAGEQAFEAWRETARSQWGPRRAAEPGGPGEVLVESFIAHPRYTVVLGILANAFREETGLRPVGLVGRREHEEIETVLRASGIEEILYLEDFKTLSVQTAAFSRALTAISDVSQGRDLVGLTDDNVPLGRFAYDAYLNKTGKGTEEGVPAALLEELVRAFVYRRAFASILEQRPIEAVVQGEKCYSLWGSLASEALRREIPVYVRKGKPWNLSLRCYREADQILTHECAPSKHLFEVAWQHYRKHAIGEATSLLKGRFSGKVSEARDQVKKSAYAESKTLLDLTEICNHFDWDPETPIGLILPHVFIDAVLSSGELHYPDYLTWYRRTLEIARESRHVNWLVKPHPHEPNYDTVETGAGVFREVVPSVDHVALVQADVNTASFHGLADALVTARGTAGLEFSCVGTPALLAGEAPYSGFGFTVEPTTREAYEAQLRRIHELEPLSQEQQDRALVCAYLYLRHLNVETNLLSHHPPTNGTDGRRFWRESKARLKETDPDEDLFYAAVKTQLRNADRNLEDPRLPNLQNDIDYSGSSV